MWEDDPHRRYNPLKDEWIIVAPQRGKRPWSGQVEAMEEESIAPFDPSNPLCPGVTRSSGEINPKYSSTFVFNNDFPALTPLKESESRQGEGNPEDCSLFKGERAAGTCRVMCFHPRSDLHLATVSKDELLEVIRAWEAELRELGKDHTWVQIFENRGAIMGCSNPHPHCQIWATKFLPNEPATKDRTQREFKASHGKVLLCHYLERELAKKERIVLESEHWVLLVPFWAVWPFETMLLPRRHVLRLTDLSEAEKSDLAVVLAKTVSKYDNLFKCAFPYSMGWHGAPTGRKMGEDCSHWQLHAIYLPPLFRSATVKKFMAGFELLAEPQRDLTPENAAKRLRQLSDLHYKLKDL